MILTNGCNCVVKKIRKQSNRIANARDNLACWLHFVKVFLFILKMAKSIKRKENMNMWRTRYF